MIGTRTNCPQERSNGKMIKIRDGQKDKLTIINSQSVDNQTNQTKTQAVRRTNRKIKRKYAITQNRKCLIANNDI